MNIAQFDKQNFGRACIPTKIKQKIKQELLNCEFKDVYKNYYKQAMNAKICDVTVDNNGRVFIKNNVENYTSEVKSFSTTLKNLYSAFKTVVMMENK